jgi:hypothetical protein
METVGSAKIDFTLPLPKGSPLTKRHESFELTKGRQKRLFPSAAAAEC